MKKLNPVQLFVLILILTFDLVLVSGCSHKKSPWKEHELFPPTPTVIEPGSGKWLGPPEEKSFRFLNYKDFDGVMMACFSAPGSITFHQGVLSSNSSLGAHNICLSREALVKRLKDRDEGDLHRGETLRALWSWPK